MDAYAARGEIPNTADAGVYGCIGGGLGCTYRDGEGGYGYVSPLAYLGQTVGMIYGYAADFAADYGRVRIESSHDIQPVAVEAAVTHECRAQRAGADDDCIVVAAEAEELAQLVFESLYFVAYASLAFDVEEGEVFGYLR